MISHVELKDICDISMGQAPVGTSYNQSGKGYPLLAGAGDFGDTTPNPKKFTNQPARISQRDDLILCIRATIGNLNWSDKEYCLGRGVAGLRPVHDKLDRKYLWHFISANRGDLEAKGTGSTFKQVGRSHIEEWKIPLPPLPEQKRIAAILDKADAIRRKRQQAIQLADQLLRAVFLEMFGDPVTNPKGWEVGTIRDLITEAKYGSSQKAHVTKGQFPMLRMGNVTYKGDWDFSDLKYVDLSEKDQPKYLLKKRDIVFNRTNSKELVGKTAVYELNEEMAIAGYLIRVRTNENANPYFISAYLNSDHGKRTLQGMCKSIVGMANINAQELQNIAIMMPPKTLQDKFEKIVMAVRSRTEKMEELTSDASDLFSSLSQKAFAGNL
ncbi:MAG: restriction endonuclease subunit S [Gammaproteobacteria bacterium]|nr:restriction endonuclease subunit S [Gammaproteobacteria bacterium]MCF6362843.1 restriction endonuclease subunit S [Gammaproteobacteria bacterium]